MIYYSTGKSRYLPANGKAVECTNTTTVEILIKKGLIVESQDAISEINEEVTVQDVQDVIEQSIENATNENIEEAEIKAEEVVEKATEIAESVVYKDLAGNTYTEEEVLKMDKRSKLYKEIIAQSK